MEPMAKSINDFWFGKIENDTVDDKFRSQWFKKDAAFDKTIEKKFSDYMDVAFMGALDRWTLNDQSFAALIIMLDQFPRNIFRNSFKAFHFDKKALTLSLQAIEAKTYLKVPTAMGYFMLMPTMHSESVEAQDIGLAAFKDLKANCPEHSQGMISSAIDYAEKHREIIVRFGRFPHRNALLERESTIEELDFLKEPGSSF